MRTKITYLFGVSCCFSCRVLGFGGGAGERERERAELIYYLTYSQTLSTLSIFSHFTLELWIASIFGQWSL